MGDFGTNSKFQCLEFCFKQEFILKSMAFLSCKKSHLKPKKSLDMK
ncbi:hypothetical protein LEP1GSC172_2988 [Leptospira noguchii]|uniref:Uncharacterized protein n=1 Tax=Leptospira noguchii TaxID=28182 RepID=M6VU13_9LEPT|nr:hypothetical protein LEP1GSC172_2988 [Leptospira noguchii]